VGRENAVAEDKCGFGNTKVLKKERKKRREKRTTYSEPKT
jgi:hypothetical protein